MPKTCRECGERVVRNAAVGWLHVESAETGYRHYALPATAGTQEDANGSLRK